MKRLAAVLLSVLMVLSMVTVGVLTVSAEETGSLKITKKIEKENTETDDKVPLSGVTFSLYKVFEKTDKGYKITNDDYIAALSEYTAGLTKTDTNTYATYGSTENLEAQIGKLLAATGSTAADHTGNTEDGGVATITGISYGVYLVVETGVPSNSNYTYTQESQPFLVNIFSERQVDAVPKNERHKLEKDIQKDSSTKVNEASYQIGDEVPYVVTTTVPKYNADEIQGLKEKEEGNQAAAEAAEQTEWDKPFSTIPFTFIDTLSSGLTLKFDDGETYADAFTITLGAGTGTSQKVLQQGENNDYTVEEATVSGVGKKYTIKIHFDSLYTSKTENYLGAPVTINYSAILNDDAVVNTDGTQTGGNGNDIKLQFRNNPSIDTTPVTFDNTDEDPKVYTYQMELSKLLDGETFAAALAAATPTEAEHVTPPKFKLSTDAAGDNIVYVKEKTADTNGDYIVCTASETSKKELLELTSTGTLVVKGLKAGTYYLTEVGQASIGSTQYTPLASPVKITVKDGNGADDKPNGTVVAYVGEGSNDNRVVKVGTDPDKMDTGRFAFEINNPKNQFNLPETGGYGILLFTLGGAVVLAGAIVLFTLARKKKTEK